MVHFCIVLLYYVDCTIIVTKLYTVCSFEDGRAQDCRALINKYWKEIRIKTTRAKYI